MGTVISPPGITVQLTKSVQYLIRPRYHITVGAILLLLTVAPSLQAMLKLADTDGDGKVDLNDFFKTMRKTSAF